MSAHNIVPCKSIFPSRGCQACSLLTGAVPPCQSIRLLLLLLNAALHVNRRMR